MQLQPLIGEEADQLAMLETDNEALTVDAPTRAAQTLLNALNTRDDSTAWSILSPRTREALTKKFASEEDGGQNMISIIRKELKKEGTKTVAQLLFGTQPKSLRSYGPDDKPSPPPARAPSLQATVFAYGHNGQVARVPFVLQNHQWFLDTNRF